MELLAPAGSREALRAAVSSGADAVYLGGTRFSARSSCANFDIEELKNSVLYCHNRGVMVHVAANTLIKENECDEFLEYLGELNDIGVDAVIIQDIGMAKATKLMYPDLPLHASTQLTCASLDGAKFLEDIGFSRIVLARELDKKSIENICKNTKAEIEVFVHGAICMSYSGQCLMSSMIGGRSGNRGHCAQPCRLPYNFINNGKNVNKGYLLSPKDMCLVNHLNELSQCGVDSLKIEGRLKRSEYVSSVVGIYRKCIDEGRGATNSEYSELLDAFNRSGFTDGYFTKNTGKNMMSYENPSNVSENKFSHDAVLRCSYEKPVKKVLISYECKINIGTPPCLRAWDDDGNCVLVFGDMNAEYAINKPIEEQRVIAQLGKLGETVYEMKSAKVIMSDNVIVPVSELNSLRRKAVKELDAVRSKGKQRRKNQIAFNFENKENKEQILSCMCRTKEQLDICISEGIKRIYAQSELVDTAIKEGFETEFIKTMPPIDKEGKNKKTKGKNTIVSSYGQLSDDLGEQCCDFRLNITNSYSLDVYKNLKTVTLSPELTINEISNIKKSCDTELIAYGHTPLMTFENCPVKSMGKCDLSKSTNFLTDRKNEKFPLMCYEGCFCVLLNSKPIYMADKMFDLKKCGVKYLRLDFTDETKDECRKIIKDYKKAMAGERIISPKENTFTRGHYYKKVD